MILGSHNSWSYLPPRKWWMRPIAFTARCQSADIRKQYELGVRCFDLRIRFTDEGRMVIAHGIVEYKVSGAELYRDLRWIDEQGDSYVRILHEARNERQYTKFYASLFHDLCKNIEVIRGHIHWWCGRNLYNWEKDYDFGDDPKCYEKYGSVSGKKWLYGWWPWLYARLHNREIREQGTDNDILLIDYVDIK